MTEDEFVKLIESGKPLQIDDISVAAAELAGVSLAHGRFRRGDFRGCLLAHADLRHADFTDANFFTADLIAANCTATSFVRANLDDVQFALADLTDADLTEANIEDAFFEAARFSSRTRMVGAGPVRTAGVTHIFVDGERLDGPDAVAWLQHAARFTAA